jgi:hypothetical protein
MTPEPLYTLKEMSEFTRKSEGHLRELIRRGLLDCHQNCPGGLIEFTIGQWQEYLARSLKTGGNEDEFSRGPRRGSVPSPRRAARRPTHQAKRLHRNDPAAYADLRLD